MTDRDYTRLVQAIEEQLQQKGRLIVAIDGRCGSGKSTLAARLERELRCSVFHMDDFFPRPEQRTAERLSQPGENVDHERFLAEVLLPLAAIRSKVKSPFVRSFLYYVPYAVLGAMTFPAVFSATGSLTASAIGAAVALVLGWMGKSLLTVAAAACVAALAAGMLLP